jgi:MSHA biogenesis protein MshL
MKQNLILSLVMLLFLAGCASPRNNESALETTRSIDAAMAEASQLEIPETEAPSDDILDELVPGSGFGIIGLEEDINQETAFDISVSNAPARLFFMSLVKDTDINMIVHPTVNGEISLDLKNVVVGEVMELVREVYGYEFKVTQSGYIVLPSRIQSKIFAVNYLNVIRNGESMMTVSSGQIADSGSASSTENESSSSSLSSTALQSSSINTSSKADFWSGLAETLRAIVGSSEGRSIVVDRHAGLVIVRAMPGELRDVENYLRDAQDSMQRQVILETRIIEVTLSDSFQSGIDWSALSNDGNTLIGLNSVVNGSSPGNVIGGNGFANLFTASGTSNNFNALIQLLSSQGEVQVLSSPRVSTVNNQKAVIKVGSDEFFVTEVSSSTTSSGTSTTSNPEITLTPFFSGIALDVTPQISSKNEVILHIHPSVSEITDQIKNITVGGQTQQLPLAFSSIRESDSIVKARNGQVVVIGGLMQNSSANDDAGLPGLADIPIIGNLFKQQKKVNTRSELVILLRPIVVNSNKTWTSYIKDSQSRVEELRDPSEGE